MTVATPVLNPVITKAGLALVPSGSTPGLSVKLTHIAIGTGLYNPTNDDFSLRSEVARYAISSGTTPTPTSLQIGTTITDTDPQGRSPNGLAIGEIGFYAGSTLFAVWSQPATPLFVKSAAFDVPFAYTLDISVLPAGSVTVVTTPDPAGMAALILQHEAKNDPHPQYETKTRVAALETVVNGKQPNLGFTPVQQGGGIGQATNKVYVGWSAGGQLKVTVDSTDLGAVAFLNSPGFSGAPTAPTAPLGANDLRLSNTAFVTAAIRTALVGQVAFEPRTTPRAGYLMLNGALLSRAAYPDLWAYAQTSSALVTEAQWAGGNWGCFSTGDGSTTFRIPEARGEFPRCWDGGRGVDSGRGIGSFQATQNLSHAHVASSAAVGDHVHSAWTDAQGWHGHHGNTYGAGGHNHNNGIFSRLFRPPYGGSLTGSDQNGSGSEQAVGAGDSADIVGVGDHAHSFDTDGAGSHGHNVGIGGAGNHAHTIYINADGGNESRPRNIALSAMIRAY